MPNGMKYMRMEEWLEDFEVAALFVQISSRGPFLVYTSTEVIMIIPSRRSVKMSIRPKSLRIIRIYEKLTVRKLYWSFLIQFLTSLCPEVETEFSKVLQFWNFGFGWWSLIAYWIPVGHWKPNDDLVQFLVSDVRITETNSS